MEKKDNVVGTGLGICSWDEDRLASGTAGAKQGYEEVISADVCRCGVSFKQPRKPSTRMLSAHVLWASYRAKSPESQSLGPCAASSRVDGNTNLMRFRELECQVLTTEQGQ